MVDFSAAMSCLLEGVQCLMSFGKNHGICGKKNDGKLNSLGVAQSAFRIPSASWTGNLPQKMMGMVTYVTLKGPVTLQGCIHVSLSIQKIYHTSLPKQVNWVLQKSSAISNSPKKARPLRGHSNLGPQPAEPKSSRHGNDGVNKNTGTKRPVKRKHGFFTVVFFSKGAAKAVSVNMERGRQCFKLVGVLKL